MRPPLHVCSLQPRSFFLSAALLAGLVTFLALAPTGRGQEKDAPGAPTPGALTVVDPSGQQRGFCPLRHTDVRADIAGLLARVTVTRSPGMMLATDCVKMFGRSWSSSPATWPALRAAS